VLSLDSARLLTRGSPVGVAANLSWLHPAHGTYTGVSNSSEDGDLFGQVNYAMGGRSAHLSFIAPGSRAGSPALVSLLDGLAWQAGDWGAFHLLGEVDELSPAFEGLRKAGFSVYAWQRIWQLPADPGPNGAASPWQPVDSQCEQAVRSLYQMLVPPLVQSAEPLPARRLRGLVHRQQGEIMAYVEGVFGPRGIYLYPLVHPDLAGVDELLRALPAALAPLLRRPIYLAARSYQAFLESALGDLDARCAPRQALMVKHLALAQRVPLNVRLVQVEGRQAEPAKITSQPAAISPQPPAEDHPLSAG
jgi:hypothetical protein